MKTLQEKYNAILEGNFSKVQFVRDARLAHSNLITQFNSFADTVAILKNKGMVVEAKKAEVTAYKKPEVDPIDMVAPDLLDHGIEAELHAAGITGTPSEEEYAKAKEKAAKELIKDPLCYKNAQTMTEPGEKMEKAKLNEDYTRNDFLHNQQKVRDLLRNKEVAAVITAGSIENSKPFVKKLMKDPESYVDNSPKDIIAAFQEFEGKGGVTEYSGEEEGSGYSYEYKEGNGASEKEIQGNIDHYKKNPLIWKMQAKKDFENMAAGKSADTKTEHYPEWKKEDFKEVLKALGESPNMSEDDSQLKSDIVLTPAEKATLQDLTESINEGMVDLSKVKDYAKKGLMTLGVIATLLGGANLTLQQKQDVVDTVKTEIPSENQKDLQYMSDAAIAHSLYLTNKADVEKLAQTNSDIYLLIKDSKFQNFDKLDRVQDKITIGRSNQEAIQLIKDTVLEGVVKSAQLKEAIKSLIKKTLES